jgi:hypothetical protein
MFWLHIRGNSKYSLSTCVFILGELRVNPNKLFWDALHDCQGRTTTVVKSELTSFMFASTWNLFPDLVDLH